jgi:hypothetical protein
VRWLWRRRHINGEAILANKRADAQLENAMERVDEVNYTAHLASELVRWSDRYTRDVVRRHRGTAQS